jgi:hypothetical protein
MKDSLRLLATMIISILSTCLFSGCLGRNIPHNAANISPDKGVLLTKIHSNLDSVSVYIAADRQDDFRLHEIELRDRKTETYLARDPDSITGSTKTELKVIADLLKVVTLEGGNKYISKVSELEHGLFFELEPCNFNIEPGTILYIGDLYIDWDIIAKGSSAQIKVSDNEGETISEAKEKYSWLFEKFEYKKKIIKLPPDKRYPLDKIMPLIIMVP